MKDIAKRAGGKKRHAAQHAKGKRTARLAFLYCTILCTVVWGHATAAAQQTVWTTSDDVASLVLPEGWQQATTFGPRNAELTITAPEMRSDLSVFAACSLVRDVLSDARSQEEANRMAGEWADRIRSPYSDATSTESVVGGIRIISIGGSLEQDGFLFRDSTRIFQLGNSGHAAVNYLVTCRTWRASAASESEVDAILNSLTLNVGPSQ